MEHQKFGLGSVVSCNEEYIVIKFDDHGEKKFIASMVLPSLKRATGNRQWRKRATRARRRLPLLLLLLRHDDAVES